LVGDGVRLDGVVGADGNVGQVQQQHEEAASSSNGVVLADRWIMKTAGGT
jgi:hypothetical protein